MPLHTEISKQRSRKIRKNGRHFTQSKAELSPTLNQHKVIILVSLLSAGLWHDGFLVHALDQTWCAAENSAPATKLLGNVAALHRPYDFCLLEKLALKKILP